MFQKENWNTLHFFYSEKSSKIAQIYFYDPKSGGINLQSPQSDSTHWKLNLVLAICSISRIFSVEMCQNLSKEVIDRRNSSQKCICISKDLC